MLRTRTRIEADGYLIDPLVVVNAIIERVFANGRTTPLHAQAA